MSQLMQDIIKTLELAQAALATQADYDASEFLNTEFWAQSGLGGQATLKIALLLEQLRNNAPTASRPVPNGKSHL